VIVEHFLESQRSEPLPRIAFAARAEHEAVDPSQSVVIMQSTW